MKEVICTVCPRGCQLQVDEISYNVSGNHCERGAVYGAQELRAPMRTLTSTVCLWGSSNVRRCPVKTNGMIPKERMLEAVHSLNLIQLCAPVRNGQVIVADFLGLGVDVVATRTIEE